MTRINHTPAVEPGAEGSSDTSCRPSCGSRSGDPGPSWVGSYVLTVSVLAFWGWVATTLLMELTR